MSASTPMPMIHLPFMSIPPMWDRGDDCGTRDIATAGLIRAGGPRTGWATLAVRCSTRRWWVATGCRTRRCRAIACRVRLAADGQEGDEDQRITAPGHSACQVAPGSGITLAVDRTWPGPGWTRGPSRRARSGAGLDQDGQDLGGEPLELLKLIVADEANAEVGDAGLRVSAQCGDHGIGRTQADRAALMDAAAIVCREEFGGDALGVALIVIEADRRVDADRKVRLGAAARGPRLQGQLAHPAALFRVDVRRDDAVAEAREAVELRGQHLASIAGGDQHGRARLAPRQRADAVIDEAHVVALIRDGRAAPQK